MALNKINCLHQQPPEAHTAGVARANIKFLAQQHCPPKPTTAHHHMPQPTTAHHSPYLVRKARILAPCLEQLASDRVELLMVGRQQSMVG